MNCELVSNHFVHKCKNEDELNFLFRMLESGNWLVRESQSQKGCLTLTFKTAQKIYHVRLGAASQLTDHQINEWVKNFAKEKHFFLTSRLSPLSSRHFYEMNFSSHPEIYEKFKQIWQKKIDPNHISGSFDDQKLSFITSHSKHELLALENLHQEGLFFIKLFGERYSIFKGYYNDIVKYKRMVSYPTNGETEDLSEASSRLLHFAKTYFSIVEGKDFAIDTPTNLSFQDLLRDLLVNQGFPGLIIGEQYHSQSSSKQFVMDQLNALKEMGVTTLFIEHLPYDGLQKLLDSHDVDMPILLNNYLQSLDAAFGIPAGKAGFTALVTAAKEAGLKIVAIDSEASYNFEVGTNATETQMRLMAMNYLMLERMKQNPCEGKFIVFTGLAHVSTFHHVPGLSQLLHCPAIALADGLKEKVTLNVQHHKEDQEYFHGTIHAYIEIAP